MSADPPSSTPGARFVDPQVLARIGNLKLLARNVVDGFINGLHKAPYLGVSIDFAEHRGYMPGDDIRFIDWKVFARTDRFYVKQFEADTNANFSVLFDVSRSMSFASRGISKLDYGRYLAGCLTYFATTQRDRVGIVTFDDDIVTRVPPSAKHLDVVLHTLDRIEAGRPGEFEKPLFRMTEFFKRRGILLLISDLYDEPEVIVNRLKPLSYGGNDLIVFHVLDPAEVDFPYAEAGNFRDLRPASGCRWCPRSCASSTARSSRSTSSGCRSSAPRTRSTTRSSTPRNRWTTGCSGSWRCARS